MKSIVLSRILLGILVVCNAAAVPLKRSVATNPDSRLDPKKIPTADKMASRSYKQSIVKQQAAADLSTQVAQDKVSDRTPLDRHSRDVAVSRKTLFVMCMAFLTGTIDTVVYRRFNCYVNMMTGNTIKFAMSLAESRWTDALFHVSLITSYVVGVGIFRCIDIKVRHGKEKGPSNQLLPTVAPLILCLFVLADVVSHVVGDNTRLHAPLLSIGFGIMNAASADATGGTILYAMTGHLSRIGKTYVDYLLLGKTKCFKSFKSHLRIVCCFAAGIGISAKAAQYLIPLGFHLPMATTAGIIYTALFLWYGSLV